MKHGSTPSVKTGGKRVRLAHKAAQRVALGTGRKSVLMTNPRYGSRYRKAVADLRARGQEQNCWRCGKPLFADAPKGHPNSITLGHLTALEDGGSLLDPNNIAPECPKCNYGDGAARTNRKKRGDGRGVVYRNPNY